MSKSTPITQLPNILLNDPQRQAQVNSNNTNAPVASPQSADDIIQETLSQLNISAPTVQQQAVQVQAPSMSLQQPQSVQQQDPYQYDITSAAMYENSQPYIQQSFQQQLPVPQDDLKQKVLKDFGSWNTDIQLSLFAASFFIALNMIPLHKVIYKYISLDKVPYSDVVIKAALMFVFMILAIKFLKD